MNDNVRNDKVVSKKCKIEIMNMLFCLGKHILINLQDCQRENPHNSMIKFDQREREICAKKNPQGFFPNANEERVRRIRKILPKREICAKKNPKDSSQT